MCAAQLEHGGVTGLLELAPATGYPAAGSWRGDGRARWCSRSSGRPASIRIVSITPAPGLGRISPTVRRTIGARSRRGSSAMSMPTAPATPRALASASSTSGGEVGIRDDLPRRLRTGAGPGEPRSYGSPRSAPARPAASTVPSRRSTPRAPSPPARGSSESPAPSGTRSPSRPARRSRHHASCSRSAVSAFGPQRLNPPARRRRPRATGAN